MLLSISSLQVGVYPDTEKLQDPEARLKPAYIQEELPKGGSERSHGPPEPDGRSGDLRA